MGGACTLAATVAQLWVAFVLLSSTSFRFLSFVILVSTLLVISPRLAVTGSVILRINTTRMLVIWPVVPFISHIVSFTPV